MIQLSSIWTFPLKSGKGIFQTQAEVLPRGLRHDRRWLLVDAQGRFLTQREHAKMTHIKFEEKDTHWLLSAHGFPTIKLQNKVEHKETRIVTIWRDQVRAHLVSEKADLWFSQFMGFPCQLVFMRDTDQRLVESWPGVDPQTEVSFADGYPLLLIGEGSLLDLNSKLEQPVTMSHFRPNLVISGAPPFAEDTWQDIAIGEVHLKVVKPCSRCVMTTLDPGSGVKLPKGEPLRTLSKYRTTDQGVMFGQNLIVTQPGIVKVGDEVRLLPAIS